MPGVFFASATQATLASVERGRTLGSVGTLGSEATDGFTAAGLTTGNFSESKYRKSQESEPGSERVRVPDKLHGFRHVTLTWGGSGSKFVFDIVKHPFFRFFVNVTIVVNAIQMGAAADHQTGDWKDVWWVCDNIFTTVFVLEMIMKILGFGKDYFLDGWNILDFLVAWISVADCWIIGVTEGEGKGLGVVRVFRLLRLLRMTKVLRVVPELVVVLEGILYSMRSMFWVLLLLTIILYAFGIVCVEVIGSSTDYSGSASDNAIIKSQVADDFNAWQYFGSLSRSMVSLFSMIILSEWSQIMRPIWEVQTFMIPVFVFLVVVTTFGVLNVIIGIIVERTTAAMNAMREKHYKALKQEQMGNVEKLADIMFELDENLDEKITLSEFEAGFRNERLTTYLRQIDFPLDFRFQELHHMLDIDGSGGVTKNEFVNGIMRLIYCNQFQRDCLLMSSLGRIKAMQVKFAAEMRQTMNSSTAELHMEIKELRRKIASPTQPGPPRKPHFADSSREATESDMAAEPDSCVQDCNVKEIASRQPYFTEPPAFQERHHVSSEAHIVDLDRLDTRQLEREWEPDPVHLSPPSLELLSTRVCAAEEQPMAAFPAQPEWQQLILETSSMDNMRAYDPIGLHYRREPSSVCSEPSAPISYSCSVPTNEDTHDTSVNEPIEHGMVELIRIGEAVPPAQFSGCKAVEGVS